MLAQVWITRHIWTPKFKRLEPAEVLFVAPYYDSLLIDQSLTLNRRRERRAVRSALHMGDDEDDDGGIEEIGRASCRERV